MSKVMSGWDDFAFDSAQSISSTSSKTTTKVGDGHSSAAAASHNMNSNRLKNNFYSSEQSSNFYNNPPSTNNNVGQSSTYYLNGNNNNINDFNVPTQGGNGPNQFNGFQQNSNSAFYNPNQYDTAAPSHLFGHHQQSASAADIAVSNYANSSYEFGEAKSNFINSGPDNFGDEPPLLQELGINIDHIVQKTLTVLNPMRSTRVDVASDSDLAGPLVFGLAFGFTLLLSGKVHFNYIYGFGLFGCVAMYALLTLMALEAEVSLMVVASTLGYCILPMSLLALVSLLLNLSTDFLGIAITASIVMWCSLSASKLFVTAFKMDKQQLLVAYPCSLLYAVFALLTVF